MIPIELKKRYPHSREEDITDAFMRGYQACAAQGGDAEMDNCQVQAPQNYMQQSRHDDGRMTREEAIQELQNCIGLIQQDGQDYLDERDIPLLDMAIEALSADAVQGEWIQCSERLPKEKARVLTYDTMGDVVFGQYDKGQWYWEAEACADYWAKNDGVIAWMPLPTPYKGGDAE